jgi:3,4-dihydroxy 2-butanone 4-phosphate synthase/GTP cyclohydrolase II
MAQPGGVLRRAGHTEAGCDLARLAGFDPAASVLVEILNEDGTMARRPDLEIFAAQHQLKIGTIADLIRYRIEHERTVQRVASCNFPSEFGLFQLIAYQDSIDNALHLALVKGDIQAKNTTLVRVHIRNKLCDLPALINDECGYPLRDALHRIAQEESGVVVVLFPAEDPQALIERIKYRHSRDQGEDLPAHPVSADLRTYGLGAQILADLGIRKMRVLSAPKKMHAISGFGLEVVDYVTP